MKKMKLSAEALPDTGRKTCSLHKLLSHSQRRRRSEVGPEFLFLQRGNHKQQCLVKLTGSVSQRPIGASEPWKEGLCFSPVSKTEGRVITIRCLEERSRAGSVCVCVCVHACTVTQLNPYTDTDSFVSTI